jgi:4-amino-4-deoxychorismate lyase
VTQPALINGQSADSIQITDRGLHYGDGLFETIAVCDGELLCWDDHMERLQWGCGRLHLPAPPASLLFQEARQICADEARAVLKIIITRGEGGRGYAPPASVAPNRILLRYPWPDYSPGNRQSGVRIRLCASRMGGNPRLAGIKHLNRLEQVMARSEWTDPEIAEGLTCDDQARVIEGTMSNLFLVRGQQLLTPDLSDCGIAGIVRKKILAAAPALGLTAGIGEVRTDDLAHADELFLCNSVIGLWPVRQFEGRTYPVGPVTQQIRDVLIEQRIITPD